MLLLGRIKFSNAFLNASANDKIFTHQLAYPRLTWGCLRGGSWTHHILINELLAVLIGKSAVTGVKIVNILSVRYIYSRQAL